MARFAARITSSHGGWGESSDLRWLADPARGLAYLADASGPRYGGYYAPFAIEPGLEALLAAFDRTRDVHAALLAADEQMRQLCEAHEAARTERGLPAALLAADHVRPKQRERLRGTSYAHFTASCVACCIDGDAITFANVVSCHAYHLRDGALAQIVGDHALIHAGTVIATTLLGMGPSREIADGRCEVVAGDQIVLCTRERLARWRRGGRARGGGGRGAPAART